MSNAHHAQQLLRRSYSDEAWDVDIDECCHQELAIESIHDSTMSRNGVTEILQMENFHE